VTPLLLSIWILKNYLTGHCFLSLCRPVFLVRKGWTMRIVAFALIAMKNI